MSIAPTRQLVLQKIHIPFPDSIAAKQALTAIDAYRGAGGEGLHLAAIYLSGGQLWKLRQLLRTAKKGWRDVIYEAQSPTLVRELRLQKRIDPTQMSGRRPQKQSSPNKKAALEKKTTMLRKRELKQYHEWLLG